MLAVRVSSAATGQELCVIQAGRDWTVHELNAKLASQQGAKPHSQTILQGVRVLQSTEFLRDFLEEGSGSLELQVLRKSWVVTVVDERPEPARPEAHSDSDGEGDASRETREIREMGVEAHPECTLGEFCVMVAEMLQLEAATQPDLYFQGDFLDNQDFDAMGSSLDSFGIQGGSTVRVRGTSELPLLWKGRGAMTSRRSEFLESNAALCLIDQCQAGQLLAWFEDMEPSTPRAHEVLHPGTGKGHCDSVSALSNLLSESECESIAQESERLAVAPMDVKCIRGTRRYQRVIVQDEELAKHLWTRAKPAVQAALAGQSLRPLGFGCVQGDWELEGLNPCFRVNSYGAGGCLKPHRDAPFSPEANVRSLCTLLIPLSSVGRTRFFHPVQDKDFRGMTLKEELEARGGLDTGFQALDVCLTAGCGLLFGQSLLLGSLKDSTLLKTSTKAQSRVSFHTHCQGIWSS